MTPDETVDLLKKWLSEERLSAKAQNDPRAHAHFLVRYPSGKQGHMFAIVVPKGGFGRRVQHDAVDEGQQKEMKDHMDDEDSDWSEWIHESRLHLIRTGVDWVIHMGHAGEKKPGPLQAFNVSLPIWFDGLSKHEFMNSLRRLWLAKLALIHEIKYPTAQALGSRVRWTTGQNPSPPMTDNPCRTKLARQPRLSLTRRCRLAQVLTLRMGLKFVFSPLMKRDLRRSIFVGAIPRKMTVRGAVKYD